MIKLTQDNKCLIIIIIIIEKIKNYEFDLKDKIENYKNFDMKTKEKK